MAGAGMPSIRGGQLASEKEVVDRVQDGERMRGQHHPHSLVNEVCESLDNRPLGSGMQMDLRLFNIEREVIRKVAPRPKRE